MTNDTQSDDRKEIRKEVEDLITALLEYCVLRELNDALTKWIALQEYLANRRTDVKNDIHTPIADGEEFKNDNDNA